MCGPYCIEYTHRFLLRTGLCSGLGSLLFAATMMPRELCLIVASSLWENNSLLLLWPSFAVRVDNNFISI